MAIEVVSRGVVARLKAAFSALADGAPSPAGGQRFGRWGEAHVLSPVPSKALLAQEGSYFTANNNQSGLATAASPNAFSATNPFIVIQNNAAAGSGTLIVPDYAALVATVAGTAGTNVQCAITKDPVARYTSGGTVLTPQKPNINGSGSIASVWAGNITAAAAGPNVQTMVGLRYLMGAIPVAGDLYALYFGSVDGTLVQGKQTINMVVEPVPPCVVNPGETLLIYIWLAAQTAASSYAPEVGWWEW